MTSPIITPPVKRYATLEARIENAIDRAKNELHHNARRITDTHFKVYSQSNNADYDVFVTSSGLKCSCKAGQFSKPCKHAARVGLRLQREGYQGVY